MVCDLLVGTRASVFFELLLLLLEDEEEMLGTRQEESFFEEVCWDVDWEEEEERGDGWMLLLVEDDNLLLLIVVIDEYVVEPVGLKGTNSATSGFSEIGLSEPCTACRGHLVGLSWRRINQELVKDSLSF